MKLLDSEILFLSQILFHLKNSGSHQWDYNESLNVLLEKCEAALLKSPAMEKYSSIQTKPVVEPSEGCVWHEEYDASSDDSEEMSELEELKFQTLIELEPLKVVQEEGRRKLIFEKGISSRSLDISLDNGEEILCDVTRIERTEDTLEIDCANGWVTFEVNKFPKDWTSTLVVGVLYGVVP